jgi:MFS family permease
LRTNDPSTEARVSGSGIPVRSTAGTSGGAAPHSKEGLAGFLRRFGGVGSVSLLSYVAEYSSYIVVLAYISTKLILTFHLGTFGYAFVGTASALYLVLSGLIAIPVGHYADKFGLRRFTVAGCLLGSFALFLLLIVDRLSNLTWFFIGVTISLSALGLAHGTYTASTLAYTGDVAEAERFGKPYGLVEGAEFLGYAFGPSIGAVLSVVYGRFILFGVSGIVLLFAAIIGFLFMKSDSDILRERASVGTGVGQLASLPETHSHVATWNDFVSAFRTRIVGVVLVTTLLASLGFSAFFYYVPLFAQSLASKIPLLGSIYPVFQSIVAGVGFLMMIPFGHIEDTSQRRMPYLVVGFVVGAIALALAFSFPSVPGLISASVVFGFSLAMTRVSQLVILAEHSTVTNRAGVMGTNHALEHTGYGIGSFVGGVVVAITHSFIETFQGLSVFLVLTGIAFLVYAISRRIK